eukprot:1231992-Lingulodinium_polyedra.AAC.1
MALVNPASLRSLPIRPATWRRPAPRRLTGPQLDVVQKWDRVQRLAVVAAAGVPAHRISSLGV